MPLPRVANPFGDSYPWAKICRASSPKKYIKGSLAKEEYPKGEDVLTKERS